MPRAKEKRVRRLWPLSVSVTELAAILDYPRKAIERELKSGALICYVEPFGRRKQILIPDAIDWYRARHARGN